MPLNSRTETQFPLGALPNPYLDAVAETAENIGAPYAMAAQVAIAVTSIATKGRLKVETPLKQTVNAEVFSLYVGESGDRKTTLMRKLDQVLRQYDEELINQHKRAVDQFEAESNTWSAKQDGMLRRLTVATKNEHATDSIEREITEHALRKPVKPRLRRLLAADISKRALIEQLAGSGESIALLLDEAGIVFNSDLISENGTLNVGWDGGTLMIDRANGTSLMARDPHLTAMLMVQPKVLHAYLEREGETARGSGFLARFMVSWPMSLKGHRLISKTGPQNWAYVGKFHDRIREMLQEPNVTEADGTRSSTVLEFDDDASARWIYYANGIEAAIRPTGYFHDIFDFASKAMENTSRLAGLFHHVSKQNGRISIDTLERAYAIVLYHLAEAKRIFSTDPAITELESDCVKIERYIHGKVRSGWFQLGRRYINRNCTIRDKLRFDAAMYQLASAGKVWLTRANKTTVVNFNVQYFMSLQPF